MTIEINPELEQLVKEAIQSGQFQTVDDLLTQAIHALREKFYNHVRQAAKPSSQTEWRTMRGMARGADSLTQALMRERAAEKEHDAARIQGH